tara:strand:+ start:234 stop:752 length:519 start_codon:yes stop_codon:yes gene_type:complete
MNAKDTLKAIAEALNIVSSDAKEVVSEVVSDVKEVAEDVTESVTEVIEDVKEVAEDVKDAVLETVSDVVENVGEAIEDAGEAIQEVAESIDPTPEPDNSRVNELEKQLADLKEILKNAMAQPEANEAPEVIEPEPKGLTHSPETVVSKKAASGVGKKGSSIQERVFKYINNQ